MHNTFGQLFQLTSFGESHGKAIGGVVSGCPAGITITSQDIQQKLDRRKPGQSQYTTSRKEEDKINILSGILHEKTLGTPIGFYIENRDHNSADYNHLSQAFRPSHADYTYQIKYGIRDHRGGGRASARETIARVVAGAIAQAFLKTLSINIYTYVESLQHISVNKSYSDLDLGAIESNQMRCPDHETALKMIDLINSVKEKGDTLGGTIVCVITGVPVGIGEPVFHKLHADLGHAILGINAVKGVEFGSGFSATKMTGGEHNDPFYMDGSKLRTVSNHSGGIQGGISNGEDIYFRIAFKPIASLLKNQETIDLHGNTSIIDNSGRHDITALPRAVPIVEAMAALVLTDHILLARCNQL